jgi:hypothetical protein
MNKAASTLSLLLLWVLAAGCESQGTPVRVHRKVFEVSTPVLRLHLPDDKAARLPGSAYSVSIMTPNDLNGMLRYDGEKPRLLAESTRIVNDWPAATDTWVYSPSYAAVGSDTIYSGGGVGSLGVRERGRRLEVRLDYIVDHRGSRGQKLVESKLFYEQRYPEDGVLLFHAPSGAATGSGRHHVIAFEITRNNATFGPGAPDSRRQPPQILGYR